MDNPVDTIAAQGAFRGFTIGVATIFGIPLGTILVLANGPRYAFLFSLLANIVALVITYQSDVPDIMSINHKKEKRESARILELVDVDISETSNMVGNVITPLVLGDYCFIVA
jgi:predicted MFS family arabinose efflux permease